MTCTCATCGQPLPDHGVVIDPDGGTIMRDAIVVHLRPQQMVLFSALYATATRVMTYGDIIKRVWGTQRTENARANLCVIMADLRKRLEPLKIDIRVRHGIGFFLAFDEIKARPIRPGRPRGVLTLRDRIRIN